MSNYNPLNPHPLASVAPGLLPKASRPGNYARVAPAVEDPAVIAATTVTTPTGGADADTGLVNPDGVSLTDDGNPNGAPTPPVVQNGDQGPVITPEEEAVNRQEAVIEGNVDAQRAQDVANEQALANQQANELALQQQQQGAAAQPEGQDVLATPVEGSGTIQEGLKSDGPTQQAADDAGAPGPTGAAAGATGSTGPTGAAAPEQNVAKVNPRSPFQQTNNRTRNR